MTVNQELKEKFEQAIEQAQNERAQRKKDISEFPLLEAKATEYEKAALAAHMM